jgi:DNA-binding transcriptional MerR regulator
MAEASQRADASSSNGRAGYRNRTRKSAAAFRTISEVASELDVPQYVLRFWETKFTQVRPVKRGGGRRYYRPEDVDLLRRIRNLLYTEGYTIRGVQRLLRDGPGSAKKPAPAQAAPSVKPAGPSLPDTARAELRGLLDELQSLRGLIDPSD